MEKVNVKENILEGRTCDLERMVEDAKAEASRPHPFLTVEPVEPKGGSLVKDKPFDPQPVLERMSILAASYEALEEEINATDTSRISTGEAAALNEIKRAYQAANEACLQLLG